MTADPVTIPVVLDVPLYSERVTLEGVEYILEFDYSEREARWYLDVSDIEGNPLALGVKLVANWPLLRQKRTPGLPPGRLMALDLSNQGGESPDFSDLGRRVLLTYFPSQ